MKWSLDAIRKSMLVYAVTDRAWLNGRTLAECVQQAVDGGATFVQLREKDASHDEIVRLANELLPICRKAGVPFVIDDEVEIALEVGADGVHVGQDDMACERARAMLGPDGRTSARSPSRRRRLSRCGCAHSNSYQTRCCRRDVRRAACDLRCR